MGPCPCLVHRVTAVLVLCAPFMAATFVRAEEEAEVVSQPLEVPDALSARGDVFRVVSTGKPQVTFLSRTPVETFRGTSSKLTGYAVVPREEGLLPVQLVGAEFRLPVVSLDTENPTRNEHMQGDRWMKAKEFPTISFVLREVREAKEIKQTETSRIYKATLVGTMRVVGVEKELEIPAKLTLRAESEKTRKLAPGDHLEIDCNFSVTLKDFNLGVEDPGVQQKKIAETMRLMVDVTLARDVAGEEEQEEEEAEQEEEAAEPEEE